MVNVVTVERNAVLIVTLPKNNLPKLKYEEYARSVVSKIKEVIDIPVLMLPHDIDLTFVRVED